MSHDSVLDSFNHEFHIHSIMGQMYQYISAGLSIMEHFYLFLTEAPVRMISALYCLGATSKIMWKTGSAGQRN